MDSILLRELPSVDDANAVRTFLSDAFLFLQGGEGGM